MDTYAKERISARLGEYLRFRGINPDKPFKCLNPGHPDIHPSMSMDRKRNRVHCFSCGADYDVFDIIGLDYGIDSFTDQIETVAKILGYEKPGKINEPLAAEYDNDVLDYIKRCRKNIIKTEYISGRGISEATATRFMLGYDPSFRAGAETWRAVIIPNGDGYIARNTDPNAGEKNRIRKRGRSGLYNSEILKSAEKPVFVVEGEFDVLAIAEAGGEAIGLGSVSNWRQLVELTGEIRPKAPFILVLDNDDAGKKCTKQLEEAFEKDGIQFFVAEIPEGAKDPAEALVENREAFLSFIRENQNISEKLSRLRAEKYIENRTANYLWDFINGISRGVNTPHIQTRFNDFDRKLDGGLFEGLYIIGAITSLGKTTLALQMADQIAGEGKPVLIFSLEMARNELISKSLSRLTLLHCLENKIDLKNAKTARDITTGKRYASYSELEKELIMRAVQEYSKSAENLYIHEGIGDIGASRIRETVERHVECMGEPPVVIVDYLQILAPHSDRMTDKQNTDRAVLELKRISRDYKTPVIGISSFNRQNYSQAVTMEAFKESGAIEYSSDVLIGLQLKGAGTPGFEVMAEKRKNPREVELIILKNRNGAAGVAVDFEYYPRFNYFREI